jgi:hypothetical protein
MEKLAWFQAYERHLGEKTGFVPSSTHVRPFTIAHDVAVLHNMGGVLGAASSLEDLYFCMVCMHTNMVL